MPKTPQIRHCNKFVTYLFNSTKIYMIIVIDVLVEDKYIMAECLNYMQLKYIYSRHTMC